MIGIRPWDEYCEPFEYFRSEAIRPECHPRIMDWGERRRNALVLVHGLTDSPFYMEAIGRRFHEGMGFNVVIPLLQGHGLLEPNGMRGISLEEWKRNVGFAVEHARTLGNCVSIGGLSTGGALSVYTAMHEPAVDGAVFLFSAALDLAGPPGDAKEALGRSFLARLVDFYDDRFGTPLIGDNPYRYSRVDKAAGGELAKLIGEIDGLTGPRREKEGLRQPLFVAHSEDDQTADIEGVDELVALAPEKAEFFRIGKHFRVPHASVVLKDHIRAANGSLLEPKSPLFDEMMTAIEDFVRRHLS